MPTTSSASPSPSPKSTTSPMSQRDLVVASLLSGHGTPIKRPIQN